MREFLAFVSFKLAFIQVRNQRYLIQTFRNKREQQTLRQRMSGFYRRKGQRRSKLYGRRAYEHLIKSGLVVM